MRRDDIDLAVNRRGQRRNLVSAVLIGCTVQRGKWEPDEGVAGVSQRHNIKRDDATWLYAKTTMAS